MKALRVVEPNVVELQEISEPPRRRGEVRVAVEYAGVCGSDMAIIDGSYPFSEYPLTPGHEFSGRVVEAERGSGVSEGELVTALPILTCGECAGCRAGEQNHCVSLAILGVQRDGAYAEEVVVPEGILVKVPDAMTPESVALVEPVAVAVHINRRAAVRPGQSVAVIGAGVIGNLVFQVSRARELGADWTVNSADVDPVEFTREHLETGFDVVFDLVGREATVEQAIHMTRPGGTVGLIAVPHGTQAFGINYADAFRRELSLVFSRMYDERDFDEAFCLLSAGDVEPERLVTHRVNLDQGPDAIELLRARPESTFKILLRVGA
jgi:2-desacetyl-2-hydroxyethyl bacteriochlorophyllide A dehydrogenase